MVLSIVEWVALAFAMAGTAYTLIATILGRPAAPPTSDQSNALPAVTLLKPLHSDEPGLMENLGSFMAQDYDAPIQIVFGVQSSADTAIEPVRALCKSHPEIDAELVVEPRLYGRNRKVSNLINMLKVAKHAVLVHSDSDIRVGPDYLRQVVGALEQPGVGAVTCLYTGRALGSVWAVLTSMGISYQFLANVLVGLAAGLAKPCFGSTIALRRKTLEEIGGFEALVDQLADDYEIGRAVRSLGLRVAVSPGAVKHLCSEPGPGALIRQELRWVRTIATIDPAGHAGSIVTFPVAWALIAALVSPTVVPGLTLLAALSSRVALKLRLDRTFGVNSGPIWLLPVRDIVSFAMFLASFFGRSVDWRGRGFIVAPDGVLSEHSKE